MLVLSRRLNEKIFFPTIPATVQVLGIQRGAVRLGIEAPAAVRVLREELPDRIKEWAAEAPRDDGPAADEVPKQLNRPVDTRLRLTLGGLAEARRLLQAGSADEAVTLLSKIEEDVQLLRQRLSSGDRRARVRPSAKPRKALLVEDNANEREMLAIFLRGAGLDVDTAGDGLDALEYLRGREKPDVLLLDMGLPRCDGPATVRQIRKDPTYQGLKIFAVTGHLSTEFDMVSGPGGVDRWFDKPLDPGQFVQDLFQEMEAVPGQR